MSSVLQDYVDSTAVHSIDDLETVTLDIKEKTILDSAILKGNLDLLSTKECLKLKEVVRKNVPVLQRAEYWLMFTGGMKVKESTPNLFKDTSEELFADSTHSATIPQLTTNSHFLTPSGCFKLRKLLHVIHHLNPDIVYCPMLERIATVFMHFLNEEDTFACLSGLLNNNTIEQTKLENIVADATLQDLVKLNDKKQFERFESFVTSHAETSGHKLVIFPSLRRILFDRLPFASLVRLVDCFIVEGSKILYRVALYLLNLFYIYTLGFQKLLCSSPEDLVTTIAQYIYSLKEDPHTFTKGVIKVPLSTKNIQKFCTSNTNHYKSNSLDYTEDLNLHQIVAIDLKDVSDIIDPINWQHICDWLPARMQIKKPRLVFTTDTDGYNLKTMYLKCEYEEQTLIIVRTTTNEIFGAYLSTALSERHEGHQNLSYFGTGETFIFAITPDPVCYHWNKMQTISRKVSKYVFVETQNFIKKDRPKSRRRSLRRGLSRRFSRKFTHVPSSAKSVSLNPLTASVPKNLHFGGMSEDCINNGLALPVVQSEASFHMLTPENKDTPKKKKSEDDGAINMKPVNSRQLNKTESFNVIEDAQEPSEQPSPSTQRKPSQNSAQTTPPAKRTELFISCDTTRLVVGGGGGEGLMIDGEMGLGRSTRSNTFFNAPLTQGQDGDFVIQRVDVFAFL